MWKVEKIIKKGDYQYCIVRDHPNRTVNNYVLLHRVVMENHLGRILNSNEVVHHKDENKFNNCISNLEVMTNSQHSYLHGIEQGRKWCKLKCPQCKQIFNIARNKTFLAKSKQSKLKCTCCSPSCRGKFSRFVQLNGITHEVEIAISENLVLEYVKYLSDNPEETAITGSVETTRDPPEMVKI